MDLVGFVINFVILCIVLALLYWIVMKAITLLPFDIGPATTIVQIIFGLIVLLWLLSYFGGGGAVLFYRGGHPVVR